MARKRSVAAEPERGTEPDDDPQPSGTTYAIAVGGELRPSGDFKTAHTQYGPRQPRHAGGRRRKLTPAQEAELATEARRLAREQPGRSRLDIAFDLGLIVVDEEEEWAIGEKAVTRAEHTAVRRLRRILAAHPES